MILPEKRGEEAVAVRVLIPSVAEAAAFVFNMKVIHSSVVILNRFLFIGIVVCNRTGLGNVFFKGVVQKCSCRAKILVAVDHFDHGRIGVWVREIGRAF